MAVSIIYCSSDILVAVTDEVEVDELDDVVTLVDVLELDEVVVPVDTIMLIEEPNAAVDSAKKIINQQIDIARGGFHRYERVAVELRTLEADVNHKAMTIARPTPASNNPMTHPLQHPVPHRDRFLSFLHIKQSKLLAHPIIDACVPV